MAGIVLKKGDRRPSATATAKDATGAVIDLTGYTTPKFRMLEYWRSGIVKTDAAATIVAPETSGKLQYDWAAADVDTVLTYRGEFQVTAADGRRLTVPNDGFIPVSIVGDDLVPGGLTSVVTVKGALVGRGEPVPFEHDAAIEGFIRAATREVELFCRRAFALATYTNETHVGAGGTRLYLDQWPITTLTLVEDTDDNGETWTTVPVADYYLAPENDLELKSYVVRPDGWDDGRDAIRGDAFRHRVTYQAGYTTTGTSRNFPYDVERAVADIVAAEYLYRGKPALTSESFNGLNLNFSSDRWPLSAKDVLRRYRLPRI